MEFSLKPDYEQSRLRYDAFWSREVIDRAPISIILPKENATILPQKNYSSQKDRWLDVEFRAEITAIALSNLEYLADALPITFPNLGPEIFSAWCGCGYQFGQDTTWSEPCVIDWKKDADQAVLNLEHPYFKKMVEFTERLLELGKGNFIVGLTDFHPGADHIAALRDPAMMALDMIEHVEDVQKKLASSYKEYYQVYDIFYQMLRSAGMPITSWTPLIHEGRYYIPSCDFSCMISKKMFDDLFLPGIIKECQFYDRSIYHLDGPGALRHLDSLLEIKELDAVQWVFGAGNEGYERWIKVYQKIQNAGKGIQLMISLEELPRVFETLRPEGIWFSSIAGVQDRETADTVIKRITAWK